MPSREQVQAQAAAAQLLYRHNNVALLSLWHHQRLSSTGGLLGACLIPVGRLQLQVVLLRIVELAAVSALMQRGHRGE